MPLIVSFIGNGRTLWDTVVSLGLLQLQGRLETLGGGAAVASSGPVSLEQSVTMRRPLGTVH